MMGIENTMHTFSAPTSEIVPSQLHTLQRSILLPFANHHAFVVNADTRADNEQKNDY